MHNIAVYTGRFQPLHYGHISIITKMLSENDKVIIVVGSTNKSDERNPFSFEVRKKFIQSVFPHANISIVGLDDYGNLSIWCKEFSKLIQSAIDYKREEYKLRMYGVKKDESTKKYLEFMIEQCNIDEYVELSTFSIENENKVLDATFIRSILHSSPKEELQKYIPSQIIDIIQLKNTL